MDIGPLAVTIAEACKLASVGRTTAYQAIGRGDLKIRKVGRRSIVMVDDLKAWVSSLPSGFNRDAA